MREFAQYSILKSPVYQNIPKTISSIFLNSELKSDDIKNTIIQSISHNDYQENEGKGYVINLLSLKKQLGDCQITSKPFRIYGTRTQKTWFCNYGIKQNRK